MPSALLNIDLLYSSDTSFVDCGRAQIILNGESPFLDIFVLNKPTFISVAI